jgi:hypothetical protein
MHALPKNIGTDLDSFENTGLRVLSLEELDLVSGAFSYHELIGSAFAGAVAGGMIGWAAGPGGAGSGAVLGGFGGAMAYVAYEAYQSF